MTSTASENKSVQFWRSDRLAIAWLAVGWGSLTVGVAALTSIWVVPISFGIFCLMIGVVYALLFLRESNP